ncbi:hypothetical protein WJX73_002150 [Symbiochloris irregularis]|uniref:Cyclin-like domain-containing protein n=1 Tax=Symbiochloris irregularis TaxID=706552 RepID=A0AAW1NYF3_9CHLO
MATSFEESSHRRLLVTRADLCATHRLDRSKGLLQSEIESVKIFLIRYLTDIAKESSTYIRCRVVSTASVYFKRFYLVKNFSEFDPRAVAPACLYLACKAEECQVQAKLIVHITHKLYANGKYPFIAPIDIKQILDLELAILEVLDFNLIIYSAAAEMMQALQDAKLEGLARTAWGVLNDSFLTNAWLLHSPSAIAFGCIVMAGMIAQQDVLACVQEADVSMNEVCNVNGELLRLYSQELNGSSMTDEAWHAACHRYICMVRGW